MSRLCASALCLMLALSALARERYGTVYMFGFALSFADSACVMTPVHGIDSAYINKEGFLQERTLYALQMESSLEAEHPGATCVVFWNEKRASLEKQYARLRKRYTANPAFRMKDMSDFKFVRETHFSE